MHVLPAGFHRIRYYGLLASGKRAENIARARELLMPPIISVDAIKANSPNAAEPQTTNLCPCCGGRMVIIKLFERGATPHHRPTPPTIRIDTSSSHRRRSTPAIRVLLAGSAPAAAKLALILPIRTLPAGGAANA
jgi:hypothetical protein